MRQLLIYITSNYHRDSVHQHFHYTLLTILYPGEYYFHQEYSYFYQVFAEVF